MVIYSFNEGNIMKKTIIGAVVGGIAGLGLSYLLSCAGGG